MYPFTNFTVWHLFARYYLYTLWTYITLNILQHVLTESHVHCFVSGIETIKHLDCKRFFYSLLRIYCTHITIANRIILSLYRYHTSVSIHCSHRIENMHTFWAYCVYHCKTYPFIVTYFILTKSQTQSIINRRYKS